MEKERFDEEEIEEISQNPKGKKIIWILLAVIGVALIAVVILGMSLLNSINRPGETPIFEATEDDILITPAPCPHQTPPLPPLPLPRPLPSP